MFSKLMVNGIDKIIRTFYYSVVISKFSLKLDIWIFIQTSGHCLIMYYFHFSPNYFQFYDWVI